MSELMDNADMQAFKGLWKRLRGHATRRAKLKQVRAKTTVELVDGRDSPLTGDMELVHGNRKIGEIRIAVPGTYFEGGSLKVSLGMDCKVNKHTYGEYVVAEGDESRFKSSDPNAEFVRGKMNSLVKAVNADLRDGAISFDDAIDKCIDLLIELKPHLNPSTT